MSNQLEKILKEKNLTLPQLNPVGAYIPAKKIGNLVVTSGQLPLEDGKLYQTGKLGGTLEIKDVQKSAIYACLNGLSAIETVIGDLNKIQEVIKVGVFVASTPAFTQQHLVANYVSNFLIEIFGIQGKHARFAIGVPCLPLDAPLEVELNVKFEE